MKRLISIIAVILFTLVLYQPMSLSGSDKGLKKVQVWLKGLGKNYTVKQLKNLTTLNLFENQLKTVPKEIGKLKNLTKVDLRGNQLQTVPKEIGQLTKLTELWLSGNPFSDKEKKKMKKLLPKCNIIFEYNY